MYFRGWFLLLLCLYSLQFFDWKPDPSVMDTWMHGVNLIFHEAGHVIFSPFGSFLFILGWTLGQLLLPLIVTWVFYKQEEDIYATSIGLWWLGQSLVDVAPYIADASTRSLPLLGWMSEDAHDWGNLLEMTGLLSFDTFFWFTTHYLGMSIMLFALGLGAWALWYTSWEEG